MRRSAGLALYTFAIVLAAAATTFYTLVFARILLGFEVKRQPADILEQLPLPGWSLLAMLVIGGLCFVVGWRLRHAGQRLREQAQRSGDDSL